jgi:hypothetical protein
MDLLGISAPFLAGVDASESLSFGIITTIGFILQFFGIAAESVCFKFGPYKHANPEYQKAFDKKYELISLMNPEKDYHVERILGQFFMSHNIAIGMLINLVWTVTYLFGIANRFDSTAVVTTSILFVITIFSLYVPCNRFGQACKVLHTHLFKLEQARQKDTTETSSGH